MNNSIDILLDNISAIEAVAHCYFGGSHKNRTEQTVAGLHRTQRIRARLLSGEMWLN